METKSNNHESYDLIKEIYVIEIGSLGKQNAIQGQEGCFNISTWAKGYLTFHKRVTPLSRMSERPKILKKNPL